MPPTEENMEWSTTAVHRKIERRKEKKKAIEEENRQKEKAEKKKKRRTRNEAIKVSAKQGHTYADILKKMKASVNPADCGTEVLSIRRTKNKELLVVLKKDSDAISLNKALVKAVGDEASINTLTPQMLLEIKDIDEASTKEEVELAVGQACNQQIQLKRLSKSYYGT